MTGSSTNNRMARNGIDWGSVAIFFSLMLLGWLNIYAAVFDDAARAGFSMDSRYGSQLIWMGVSVLAAVVIMLIDEIYYHILAYPSYILMLAVLLATLFIGTEVNGAKSWLRLGGFSVQPAEFAKFTTALALARYMSSYSFSMADWRSRLYAVLLLAAPMAVILLQNDAGSAIVFASFSSSSTAKVSIRGFTSHWGWWSSSSSSPSSGTLRRCSRRSSLSVPSSKGS